MLGFGLSCSYAGPMHKAMASVNSFVQHPVMFIRYCFTEVFYYLWLLQPSLSIFCDNPWTLEVRVCGIDVTLKVEDSMYSQHLDWLLVSVLIIVYCKKILLWWRLSNVSTKLNSPLGPIVHPAMGSCPSSQCQISVLSREIGLKSSHKAVG